MTVLLLAAGVFAGIGMLCRAHIPASGLSPAQWLSGEAGKTVSQALKLPMQARTDMYAAALHYRFLGDTGPQVALGCPGWLFYRDGLHPPLGGGDAAFRQRIHLMQYWSRQLRDAGIQLLVVVVPDKSRIEQAHTCGLSYSEAMRRRYDYWQGALSKAGVATLDLLPVLASSDESTYFRTDVHMNRVGAQRAAEAIAQRALPLLGGRGTQAFEVSGLGAVQPRMGDLVVLAGLEHAGDRWRPSLDMEQAESIVPVRGGGLLDDTPPVEVLYAGSSNGLRSQLVERLGKALGREVWNQSRDGGQFAGALMEQWPQRAHWPSSLKLVIWEFSEMALSLPLADDERAALAEIK